MEKNSWDLTNPKDLQKVESLLLGDPILSLGYKLIKIIFDSDTSSRQCEAAEKLIERGKKEGVEAMKIKIKNTKGFKLKLPTDEFEIDTVLGSDETMTIKVKYK